MTNQWDTKVHENATKLKKTLAFRTQSRQRWWPQTLQPKYQCRTKANEQRRYGQCWPNPSRKQSKSARSTPFPIRNWLRARYDKVATSFPTLSSKAPDQVRYALDQSLNFLKSQVLVSTLLRLRNWCKLDFLSTNCWGETDNRSSQWIRQINRGFKAT